MITRKFFKHASAFLLAAASSLLLPAQASMPTDPAPKLVNLPGVAPITDCTALASVDISQAVGASTKVTSATVADDGRPPAYCKVEVEIEDFAKSEVDLPVPGRMQGVLALEQLR